VARPADGAGDGAGGVGDAGEGRAGQGEAAEGWGGGSPEWLADAALREFVRTFLSVSGN